MGDLERRVQLLERLVEYWMRTSAVPVPDWWAEEQAKVGRADGVIADTPLRRQPHDARKR